MAIDDPPMPVVTFLNVFGIKWPYINEDSLHHFAQLAREPGQAVQQTHEDATQAVSNIAQAYQGTSTRATSSGWAHLSAAHVKEITEAAGLFFGDGRVGEPTPHRRAEVHRASAGSVDIISRRYGPSPVDGVMSLRRS